MMLICYAYARRYADAYAIHVIFRCRCRMLLMHNNTKNTGQYIYADVAADYAMLTICHHATLFFRRAAVICFRGLRYYFAHILRPRSRLHELSVRCRQRFFFFARARLRCRHDAAACFRYTD